MDSLKLLASVTQVKAVESDAADLKSVSPKQEQANQTKASGFLKLQDSYASAWKQVFNFNSTANDDDSLLQSKIQTSMNDYESASNRNVFEDVTAWLTGEDGGGVTRPEHSDLRIKSAGLQ